MSVQCPIGPSVGSVVREFALAPRSSWLEGTGVSRKASMAHAAPPNDHSDTMVERLERALVLAAYSCCGTGLSAPYIDRLERELEAARHNDPTERAKRILATYAVSGTPNAMRLESLRGPSKNDPTP
jgi:hypothetical protein